MMLVYDSCFPVTCVGNIIKFKLVYFNVSHTVFRLLRTPKRIQSTLLCLMGKLELF